MSEHKSTCAREIARNAGGTAHLMERCTCGYWDHPPQPSLTRTDLVAIRDKLDGLKFQVNDTSLWNSAAPARNDFVRIADEIGNCADQLDVLITRLSSEGKDVNRMSDRITWRWLLYAPVAIVGLVIFAIGAPFYLLGTWLYEFATRRANP